MLVKLLHSFMFLGILIVFSLHYTIAYTALLATASPVFLKVF